MKMDSAAATADFILPPEEPSPSKTVFTIVGLALIALVALYWPTAQAMAKIWWRSGSYAHGMIVIPAVLFLIWLRRSEISRLRPKVDPWALLILPLPAIIWLAARISDVQAIQHLALVSMAPLLVWLILGRRLAWAMAFPLAYLFFAAPIGEFLVAPLQDWTAEFITRALRLTGIPVLLEGLYLTIPNGRWLVAEACAGLRYLIAGVALGTLYAYLNYHSFWRRAAFIALSIAVPIVANWLRAYGIVLIGYYSGNTLAVGVDHLIYGWLFFGLVILLMFWIGSFWQDDPPPALVLRAISDDASGNSAITLTAIAGLAMLAVGPLAYSALNQPSSLAGKQIVLQAPPAAAGWQGPLDASGLWQPVFAGADSFVRNEYVYQDKKVQFFVAFYGVQNQSAELINSSNTLFDDDVWQYHGQNKMAVQISGSGRVPIKETRLGSSANSQLVWSWYWVGGRNLQSSALVKLNETWVRLSGGRPGSLVIAIASDFDLSPSEARPLMERFLADHLGNFEMVLLRSINE